MAFAEDVYERSRETRDGQGTSRSLSPTLRHFPFTNHSFLPYNAEYVVFTTGQPIAIDLPAALLRINQFSANPSNALYSSHHYLPYGLDYQPFFPLHCSLDAICLVRTPPDDSWAQFRFHHRSISAERAQ